MDTTNVEIDEALKKEAEEINRAAESPTAEQTTEEVVEPEAEVATEAEGETTETGESKKGFQSRVRELNTRAKEAEERAKSLEDRLAELTGSVEPSVDNQPFNPSEPIVADGEEITIAELNRRQTEREQKMFRNTEALITLKQKQTDAINRINSEASDMIRAYPELDPDNESFNRELSDTVTEAVEALVKADPYKASVKGFVAKLMKPYKGAVAKEVGEATENLAKQVSETALRPTPSLKAGEKSDSELTTTELENKYGVIY